VKKVGVDVQNLAPGDRVYGGGFDRISTLYRARASIFQKISDDMSLERAVTTPTAYCTAYYAAITLARVSNEDTVLIHSAATLQGQALVAVCNRIGAKVYTGASTDEQIAFLESVLDIPRECIIYNGDSSFARTLLKKTNNRGIDVVFNTLSGEGLRLGWNCTAPYGRFIDLSTQGSTENARLEMASFSKNVSFAALDFPRLRNDRPKIADKLWAEVAALFHQKEFSVTSLAPQLFNVERLGDALQSLNETEEFGQAVVVFNSSDRIHVSGRCERLKWRSCSHCQMIPTKMIKPLFRPDASYLLIGGLGGIGRASALWMIDRGAKHLIFANRSGMSKQEAKDTVAAIEQRGAKAHVQSCDVSESTHVRKLVEECGRHMPPIKGVIQGAMVLRVSRCFQSALAILTTCRICCLRK
jgi:NADPH:quinone reductase-like Zn-dependent oxidoreductase